MYHGSIIHNVTGFPNIGPMAESEFPSAIPSTAPELEFLENHALRRAVIDLALILDIRSMFSDLDETEWQAVMFTLAWFGSSSLSSIPAPINNLIHLGSRTREKVENSLQARDVWSTCQWTSGQNRFRGGIIVHRVSLHVRFTDGWMSLELAPFSQEPSQEHWMVQLLPSFLDHNQFIIIN